MCPGENLPSDSSPRSDVSIFQMHLQRRSRFFVSAFVHLILRGIARFFNVNNIRHNLQCLCSSVVTGCQNAPNFVNGRCLGGWHNKLKTHIQNINMFWILQIKNLKWEYSGCFFCCCCWWGQNFKWTRSLVSISISIVWFYFTYLPYLLCHKALIDQPLGSFHCLKVSLFVCLSLVCSVFFF